MNEFFFQVTNGSKNKGNKSIYRYKYLTKKDIFSRKLCYYNSFNLPLWCDDDVEFYWKILDRYERNNSRLFKEIKFHLPIQLDLNTKKKVLEDFCQLILKDRFTYSYAIYEKYGEGSLLLNSYACIIFNQRIIDGHNRSLANHFKRYNPNNIKLGGAKKDTQTNSKSWLDTTRKELNKIIEFYLTKNNIDREMFYGKKQKIKIPQIYLSRNEFKTYQEQGIKSTRVKEYLDIQNKNKILEQLQLRKNQVDNRIIKAKAQLNKFEMLEFILNHEIFEDIDLLKNMGIIINDKVQLVFPVKLYNYNLNYSSAKINEILFYQKLEERILPEFNFEHIKNKSTLGVHTAIYGDLNKKPRITVTNTPIDAIYRSSIDKLTVENYFNYKNIYISTFSNENNIEELISYLSIRGNFNKDLLLAFDDDRSLDFVRRMQLENKITGLFWMETIPNKLGRWKDELNFEMENIHKTYNPEKIKLLNSISKIKIIKTLCPDFKVVGTRIYSNDLSEVIQITANNLAKFIKTGLQFSQSIDFYMKIKGCSYLNACNELNHYFFI